MQTATQSSITSRLTRFFDSPVRRLLVAAVIVLGAVAAGIAYVKFFRQEPAPYFASDEEHFLYGSVGTEEHEGVPYWIWLVLPRIFPEHVPRPGGYAAVGVLSPSGHEMPIGLSKVTIGFPRVGINCAMCHTASVRLRPGDVPTHLPRGAVAPDGAAAIRAVPVRVRVGPALHRGHDPGRDRKEPSAVHARPR